jgi:tetratricopeptide (TPR) repeat protein
VLLNRHLDDSRPAHRSASLPTTRDSTTRWPPTGAAGAACGSYIVIAGIVTAILLNSTAGCATFRRRGPSSEELAESRELTRQGAMALQLGQWAQAESLMRQALDTSPDDAKVRAQLAEALWSRGASNEAMSHMAAAVRLEPKNAEYLVRAGEMALAAGAQDAALTHAERAIRLQPQLASAWALRGRTFRLKNQPERALADLQHALVFAPDRGDILLDLAVMYRERGQSARCLTTLHHLHDTYPPGEEPQFALQLEGLTLMELKRPHQAADVLAAASTRGPANADLFYQLAQAETAAGNVTAATTAAQQALAVDGSHQASRQLLTQLATQTKPGDLPRR